jgi:glycosyltransferase involved in cell wall biosynthesis
MNVLQITLRDLIGQRFNGYGLHRSLLEHGHDSEMLVVFKRTGDPRVHGYSRLGEFLERSLYASERVSSLQALLSPFALSFPLRKCFRKADLVHWQLTYPHYISVPLMPFVSRMRPTVWTLHDPWAMTGHCVHPVECERWKTGCGKCPDLSRTFTIWFDTTAMGWKAKQQAYRRSSITLVVASPWMKRRVAASPLLASLPCHLIPFGLDLEMWRTRDRAACRARLGIPPEARVLAFRMPAGHRQRNIKGVPWLIEALHRLPVDRPTYLVVFEERGALADLGDKFRIIETGWLNDESQLADALSAADVFLMPSKAESFGMMALEAMACGTPVITSADTAVADTVRAPEGGIAVPHGDAEALASAISLMLAQDDARNRMGAAGRAIVEAEYSYDRYVTRHLELYESLIDSRRA